MPLEPPSLSQGEVPSGLEARIKSLEGENAALRDRADRAEGRLAELAALDAGRLAALQELDAGEVREAVGKVGGLEGRVEAAEAAIRALQAALAALGKGEPVVLPPAPGAVSAEDLARLEERVAALGARADAADEAIGGKAGQDQADRLAAEVAELRALLGAAPEAAPPATDEAAARRLHELLRRMQAAEEALAEARAVADGAADAARDASSKAGRASDVAEDARSAAAHVARDLARLEERVAALEGVKVPEDPAAAIRQLTEDAAALREGVDQNAYALMLLAVGTRTDGHTTRPVSRAASQRKAAAGAAAPGAGGQGGAGAGGPGAGAAPGAGGQDGAGAGGQGGAGAGGPGGGAAPGGEGAAPGGEGAAPGGEGAAPGAEGAAPGAEGAAPGGEGAPGPLGAGIATGVEPTELLEALLDRDLVREKGDKAALRRLAEWVDDNAMLKDHEEEMRRLAEELARLRKQVRALAAGMRDGAGRKGEGDLAILSSKPLMGLRCMSCDRPLDEVEADRGPFVPVSGFPPGRGEVAGRAKGVPREGGSGASPPRSPPRRPQTANPAAARPPAAASRDGSPSQRDGSPPREGAPPPNWYTESHPPPADRLPASHVGPHLGPGGWRASNEPIDPAALGGMTGERAGLPAVGRGRPASARLRPGTAPRPGTAGGRAHGRTSAGGA